MAVAIAAWPAVDAGAPEIATLLPRYAAGDYDAVVRVMRTLPVVGAGMPEALGNPLDHVFSDFRSAAAKWIAQGDPAGEPHRRLVAAAFALELAHARVDTAPWEIRRPALVWACDELRRHPTHLPGERAWHLAALATMEEAGDWIYVMGRPLAERGAFSNVRAPSFFSDADKEEYTHGHLVHAQAAAPGEPRFRLAEVEFHESQTDLSTWGGPLGINGQEVSVEVIDTLRQAAAGQSGGGGVLKIDPRSAQAIVDRVDKIPAVIAEYTTLASDERLVGEVTLHLGFLHLRLEHWDEARAFLSEVPQLTTEPAVAGLSHQFLGWVNEHTNRRDEAIAEYREALRLMPMARSASILLAAQLGIAGRQREGYEVLDAALRARPAPAGFPSFLPPSAPPGSSGALAAGESPDDPWAMYLRGDALVLPSLIARMREGLK